MIDTKNRHFYYTEVDCNEVVKQADFDEACDELEKCYAEIAEKESLIVELSKEKAILQVMNGSGASKEDATGMIEDSMRVFGK